jgi:hypothetical protein
MAALDSRRDEFARLPAVCCFSRRFPLVSSLPIAECGAHGAGPLSVRARSRPRHARFCMGFFLPCPRLFCVSRGLSYLVKPLSQGRDARSNELPKCTLERAAGRKLTVCYVYRRIEGAHVGRPLGLICRRLLMVMEQDEHCRGCLKLLVQSYVQG